MEHLLDPKNDYVFKRLFSEAPALLVALINDLRPDLPDITAVQVRNPGISDADLQAKYIILDILASDAEGNQYNVEMQVRRHNAWGQRSAFYLARLLSQQLEIGGDYRQLKAAVGIHLLDFDLFEATPEQKHQALWRFEMRDEAQPDVILGNELQLNLIELKKADRLGLASGPLRDWISFFEHWQDEQAMAKITHEPVKTAMNRIKALSADEQARYRAFARERALSDEVTLLREAKEEGLQEGRQEGEILGQRRILRKLLILKFGPLPDWAEQRLDQATPEDINDWSAAILVADSLEALLSTH
jgi:predicted transposase/invertase (TIGR01784 family)